MNLDRYKHIALGVATGSLLLVGLLLLLNSAALEVLAGSGPLFVAPTGSGAACSQAAPCALQTGLAQAGDGNTVYLAGGTYTGTGGAVVTLTRSITLYGGWDGSTTAPPVRDPALHPTILDGERARRGIYISGTISPTIEGFIITRGNGTGLGGGLFAGSDAGGGIYSQGAAPIIQHNIITDNVASTQAGVRALGGGVYINDVPTAAIVRHNQILSNTAGIGIHLGDGGGLFFYGPTQVLAHTFGNNVACVGCTGQGGGLEAGWTTSDARIADNTFEGNQASRGGGLQVVWSAVDIQGNTFLDNNGGSRGGGLHAWYDKGSTINANRFISNTAISGGGMEVFITLPPFTTLTNNILARNRADTGGGVHAWSDWHIAIITLTHNTLVDNGVGVLVGQHMTATLVNNLLVSHTLAISRTRPESSVTVAHTLFWANDEDGLRGSAPVDGEPAFVDPARDEYHITGSSAARDAGVDAGVSDDIDDDPRPSGAGYDIGADELVYHIYLPLIVRQ